MNQEVSRAEFEEYCHKVDGIKTFINVLGGEALLRKEATWQQTLEKQGDMMLSILEEVKKVPTQEEVNRGFELIDKRFGSVEKEIKTMQGDIKAIYNLLEQRLP